MPPRQLSKTTRRILGYLYEHPGATPTKVARDLKLNFNTVHSAMLRHKDKVAKPQGAQNDPD